MADESVTVLLKAWRDGDSVALDRAMPLVYKELHRLASDFMSVERAGHTLSATDLVQEAYLRFSRGEQPEFQDRTHFFAIAARHMRRILIDHARRRDADKRGGGLRPSTLDESLVAAARPEELCELDDALEALATFDRRKAQAVELRYFGGMSLAEIASALEVHENTVARGLRLGEAWLHSQLRQTT
jgi:RNA polymerase sigma factor (TIGR02999 family)